MMHLKILSPSGTVAEEQIEKIALPGEMGPFMVLRNHAPLIGSLLEGEVVYTPIHSPEKRLSIRGGFVHILNNEIELCVELKNPQ